MANDDTHVYTPEEDERDRKHMFDLLKDCGQEDDKVGCVADLLDIIPPEVQALCQPRMLLLVNEDGSCQPCEDAKKDFASLLKAGIVTEKKIFMGDGARIAKKNGIEGAPALIVVDCNDNVLVDLS